MKAARRASYNRVLIARSQILLVVVLAIAEVCAAQAPPQQIAGTVVAVEHLPATGGALGRVRVAVQTRPAERALVTFDEWEALWAHGDRYRVGEQVRVEIFAASELKLTSTKSSVASGQWPAKKVSDENDGDRQRKLARPAGESPRAKCASDDGLGCARVREVQ